MFHGVNIVEYFVSVSSLIHRLEDTFGKDMGLNGKSWFVLDTTSGKKIDYNIGYTGLPTNNQYFVVLDIIYCNNCVTFEQIFTP